MFLSPTISLPLLLSLSISRFLALSFSYSYSLVYIAVSRKGLYECNRPDSDTYSGTTHETSLSLSLSLSPSHILAVSDGVWCARIHPLSTLFHQTGVVGDMELLGEEEGKGERRRLFIRRLHTR